MGRKQKKEQNQPKKNTGLRCPACGCADFRDEFGRPWETVRTVNIPGAVRRYKICRYCGRKVRTREVIEGDS